MHDEELSALLERHGVAPTTQRLEIARVLLAQAQHLSADQVLGRLHAAGARVSKATVYNTLNLFAERGLARHVIVDPAKVFFDSNVAPHQHFYNVDTGALTDIGAEMLAPARLPSAPAGTEICGVDVIVRVRGGG